MKYIQLPSGHQTIVDDEDYEGLSRYKWHTSGGRCGLKYVSTYRKEGRILMHRMVNKTPQGMFTDHINGDTLDNRKSNLRTVSSRQNGFNRALNSRNVSGHKGVSWSKKYDKWVVQIGYDGKRKNLGYFSSLEDAVNTYSRAADRIFGEYKRTTNS